MGVANVGRDLVLGHCLTQVRQDRRAVSDRLAVCPRLERIAKRVHVAVAADARIAEEVPGPAEVLASLEEQERPMRTLGSEVAGCTDPRQTSPHDEDINVAP